MPPSPKFTREQVLDAALKIIREQGERALTARSLAAALGTSTRPLFTHFATMDEIKLATVEGPGKKLFFDFCADFRNFTPAFKRFGLMVIEFARTEPNLFSFLFITPNVDAPTFDDWTGEAMRDECVSVIVRDFGLSESDAALLFREMWLHVFALCVVAVTGSAKMTAQEASDSLTRTFLGLLTLAKAGRLANVSIEPMQGAGPIEAMGEIPLGVVE